jgi:hypothetical protein
MEATQRNLRARPKILKKYRNIKSTIQNENFPKNSMFSTLKCKGAKNSYECYPTEFAGLTQNLKKNIGTQNQPIRPKNFPKKVCLVP